jgi:DNA-binding protein H-NS
MQIDKSQILDLLRQQGKQDQATQAEAELPDQVDPEQHSDLLAKFGINPQELISKFAGGGGLGGLLGG